MEFESLYRILEKVSAGKSSREAAARHFFSDKKSTEQLIRLVFKIDDPVSVKAGWVLDIVAGRDIRVLLPGLDHFTEHLHKISNESALRPLARICEKLLATIDAGGQYNKDLVLSEKQHQLLLTAAFNWLIGPHKVATKVFAMRCLYYLGKETPWVHGELAEILKEHYAHESSGYKARARDTLQRLEAFKNSNNA